MMDDFSLEEILLEHELHKKEKQDPVPPQPIEDDTKTVADKFTTSNPPLEFKPPRAATETFRVPSAKKTDSTNKNAVEKKTVTISTRTRVLTATATEEKYHTTEIPSGPQLEGQMVMDNFVDEAVDEEALENELQRRRREKVSGFKLVEGGRAFKLTGEEEETDEEEQLETNDDDDDEIEDFSDYTEAETIRSELAYRQRMSALALMATAGLEALLIVMTIVLQLEWVAAPVPVVSFSQLLLLVGIVGVNHHILAQGLKKLVTLKSDSDTPAAVGGLVGLGYCLWQLFVEQNQSTQLPLLFASVAGMAMVAGRFGRQMRLMRISRNFRFVSSEKAKKYAACMLEDEKEAAELGYRAHAAGMPKVMYYRKASFLNYFLTHSYTADPVDRVMRWFMPLVLVVAVCCTIGYAVVFPTSIHKLPLIFSATVLVSLPMWTFFSSQRATSRSCKRALKKGVMISGFAAADEYGHLPDTVILDATEIFRKEQVKLHGIKTFSGTRIDEAITDSAAVVITAGAPLAPIFKRLIENRTDILGEVDSLAFEQDMGLSGWVGGRRVLVGNRRLLANHGVDVPSVEYEERYTKDDRKIVYLSTGGELSAMFVVSYLAEPDLKQQLHRLVKAGVSLDVRSCDANISASLIAQVMEIPRAAVNVFTSAQGRAYETMIKRESNTPAKTTMASSSRAVSQVFALLQCRRLRRGVWASLIVQMAISILAMLCCVFVTVMTGFVLRADAMLAMSVVSGLIGYLVPRFFRT